MEDEILANEKHQKIVKAMEGDTVQIKRGKYKGKEGEVLVQRENSVIIMLGTNPNTGEPKKTVVNHNNYKKVK